MHSEIPSVGAISEVLIHAAGCFILHGRVTWL
jgi:hypothetical protein